MPGLGTFDVQTMLEAINATPRPRTFLRDTLFGGRTETFVTEEVMVDIFKGKRRMAPYVSPIKGGKLMEREGYETRKYKPSLVQPRDVLTPERLQKRALGESIVSTRTPADRLADEQAMILDLFDQYITRREEWMVAQLIFNGSIHMVGDGVDELFSIGFDNTETLSGADLWSEDTANPIGDMKRWRQVVMLKSGITPNISIMAEDVADAFVSHPKVTKALDTRRIELGVINPTELPNGATYIGTITAIGMDLYSYAETYVDDLPPHDTLPMIPNGKLALLPAAQRNPNAKFLYGAWTEMDEGVTYEGVRIPRSWADKGLNARLVELVSRPLPTMVDSDCWFVATVLPPDEEE